LVKRNLTGEAGIVPPIVGPFEQFSLVDRRRGQGSTWGSAFDVDVTGGAGKTSAAHSEEFVESRIADVLHEGHAGATIELVEFAVACAE
jgi:hypothetical protein